MQLIRKHHPELIRYGIFFWGLQALFTFSCEHAITRTNEPADIQNGKNCIAGFYNCVTKRQFEDGANYFSKSIPLHDGVGILEKLNNHLGPIEQVKFITGSSLVHIVNEAIECKYNFTYEVKYNSKTVLEDFILECFDDSLKITSYKSRLKN